MKYKNYFLTHFFRATAIGFYQEEEIAFSASWDSDTIAAWCKRIGITQDEVQQLSQRIKDQNISTIHGVQQKHIISGKDNQSVPCFRWVRKYPYLTDGTVPLYTSPTNISSKGPNGDDTQIGINCVLFTAPTIQLARCRADQMAVKDFNRLSHASQLLRLYSVQAIDRFTQDDHNKYRDQIQNALVAKTSCTSQDIVKIGKLLFQDSPQLSFTASEATICCDLLAMAVDKQLQIKRFTGITITKNDWKHGTLKSILLRKFGGVKCKATVRCTQGNECAMKRYKGFVLYDRLSPVLWLTFSHPIACDVAEQAGILSQISLSTWTSSANANASTQGTQDEERMERINVQMAIIAIWFYAQDNVCFVRVKANGKQWHYNGTTGTVEEIDGDWTEKLDMQRNRIIAVFFSQQTTATPV